MKPANNERLFFEDLGNGYFKITDSIIYRTAIRHGSNKYGAKFIKIPPKEMTYINTSGYLAVNFYRAGKQYLCLTHRIIWIYYNGEIPPDLQVNHKNGIKTDNRLENMELVTASENIRHAFRIGLLSAHKGEDSASAKLKTKDVEKIRELRKKGVKLTEIANIYNISFQHVSNIAKGKRWAD